MPEAEREQLPVEILEFKDAQVYKTDDRRDLYSKEADGIIVPAIVNVVTQVRGGVTDVITVDIQSDVQDMLSEYKFERGRLRSVNKSKKIYDNPKWREGYSADEFTEEVLAIDFVDERIQPAEFRLNEEEPVKCLQSERCKAEIETIFNDIRVYEKLRFYAE